MGDLLEKQRNISRWNLTLLSGIQNSAFLLGAKAAKTSLLDQGSFSIFSPLTALTGSTTVVLHVLLSFNSSSTHACVHCSFVVLHL